MWWVPLAAAAISIAGNAISQRRQAKHNRQLAEYQAEQNESYLQAQNAYNTPAAQRARMEEGGYNPNLFYGQGNPGNQASSLSYPEIGRTNMSLPELVPLMNQSMLTQSQVQATNAKTMHTYAMTQLNQLQQQVLKKNPLLDREGFDAIISALKSTAAIKAGESEVQDIKSAWYAGSDKPGETNGFNLMNLEFNRLVQQYDLANQDQAIKAQILKSKEFQNSILEVQKKFMTESEITPQHVLQFIQLLLMKML